MLRLLRELLPNLPRRLATVGALQSAAAIGETAFVATTVYVMSGGGGESTGGLLLGFGGGNGRPSAGVALLVALAALAVRMIAQAGSVWYWARGVEHYERSHRDRLLSGLLNAEWQLQSREPAGRLQHLLTHHTESVSKAYTTLAWCCIHATTALLLLAAAVAAGPFVAVAGAVLLVVLQLFAMPLAKRCRDAALARAKAMSRYVHLIGQTTSLLRELRVFRGGDALLRRAGSISDEMAATRRAQNVAGSLRPAVHQTAAGMLLIAGLAWSLFGGVSAASSVVCLVLLLRCASAVQHLQTTWQQLQEVRPFLAELQATISQYAGASVPAGGLELAELRTLELRGVGFCYVPDVWTLRETTLTLRRGDVVAVVGPSGAGKSTLAQLLLQLHRPNEGAMLVNGAPIELFKPSDWFRHVGFMPQEPGLFHASITDCIRFDRPELTKEDVRRAADAAGLAEDLRQMSAGLETLVGERGTALSFGQRQRVCLARAIAGRPQMVVLDEPTAALDAATEEHIVRAVEALRGETLVIVVTHRPALLRACDRVLEVVDGMVRERPDLAESVGSHNSPSYAAA
ncbi:MAG: ABC transporter ATP-binding protein [Planctomycetes bacterium]|nr:ABC transporter ATP-binding protein [Planctomycetota bacterium]